jgi:hypothetical protein
MRPRLRAAQACACHLSNFFSVNFDLQSKVDYNLIYS